MWHKVTENMSIELSFGATGAYVDSIVNTSFGSKAARNQIYYDDDVNKAKAFFQGMVAAFAITK